MSKRTPSLILIIFALVCFYTVFWFHKTDELKKRVVKETRVMEDNIHGVIEFSYEDVSRAGYPFDVELVYTNPKLSHVGHDYRFVHEGKLTIGTSLFDKEKVWIKTAGSTTVSVGKEQFRLLGSTLLKCDDCDGEYIRHLYRKDLNDHDFMEWASKALRNATIELKDFAIVNISQDKDVISPEAFKMDRGYINLQSSEKDGLFHFSFDFDVKGFRLIFEPNLPTLFKEYHPAIDRARLEKVTVEFGPSNFAFLARGTIPAMDHPFYSNPSVGQIPDLFSFALDKFDFNNGLGTYHSNALVDFKKLADNQFRLAFFSEDQLRASPKLQLWVIDLIKLLDGSGDFRSVIAKHSSELVPNFAQFGLIESKHNLEFLGKLGLDPEMITVGSYDLKDLKLGCDLYGLEIKGKIMEPGFDALNGHFNIRLTHYHEMLRDLRNYYNKWAKILVESKIAIAIMPVISESFVDRLSQFLASLSTEKDKDNIDIPIVIRNTQGDNITIGGKNTAELLQSFFELQAELKAEIKKGNE